MSGTCVANDEIRRLMLKVCASGARLLRLHQWAEGFQGRQRVRSLKQGGGSKALKETVTENPFIHNVAHAYQSRHMYIDER